MELLAPAGNIENFQAAIHAGADAVYVGVPSFNARNLSKDLSLAEIAAIIQYAQDRQKKVYLALNSLILEEELPLLIKTLLLLEKLQPDALIVQDFAVIQLVRRHFPNITLHASTLMGAHNSDVTNYLHSSGCSRVVLARELTLAEIQRIARRTKAELEVFVHGAMCYSFSGLCLFSSFLGGKSGVRGRCVQPCRRNFHWRERKDRKKARPQKKDGGMYLFSMNDLEGFQAIRELRKSGVKSIKLEGRLRSANYVGKIVEAYRRVLDADDNNLVQTLRQAAVLVEEAMGRKTSTGYFFSPQPKNAITPHHSGNLGLHIGRFSSFQNVAGKMIGKIRVKYEITEGDRLRMHFQASGERQAFTLKEFHANGAVASSCLEGQTATIVLPLSENTSINGKVDLYKVDTRRNLADREKIALPVELWHQEIRHMTDEARTAFRQIAGPKVSEQPPNLLLEKRKGGMRGKKGKSRSSVPLTLWLRTDSPDLMLGQLPFRPAKYLLSMEKPMLAQSSKIKRYLGKESRSVIWALPPVILDSSVNRIGKHVRQLIGAGFRSFQLSHAGQLHLFENERVRLYGDYTLNIANSRAFEFFVRSGIKGAQLAIELDRGAIYQLVSQIRQGGTEQTRTTGAAQVEMGLCVYGAPPLFTSRMESSHFQFNKKLVSPKEEEYYCVKSGDTVLTLPARPFSLLPYLQDIVNLGIDYGVVDLRYMKMTLREQEGLAARLSGEGQYSKLPTFNYLGKLE